jgi:hypothetical protein
MRFMLMVKGDSDNEPGPELLMQLDAYDRSLRDAGAWVRAERLRPSRAGCRVKLTHATGQFSVTEGPFADAASLAIGYWIVRVTSKAEAIAWAERLPVADGCVELRKLYETEDFPVDEAEEVGGWRDQEIAYRERAEAAAPAAQPSQTSTKPRFLLLLRGGKTSESGARPAHEVLTRMSELMDGLVSAGELSDGEGLKPSAEGARVYAGNRVMDGPFTETKELVAGYLVLHATSRADAAAFAHRWLEIQALVAPEPESVIEVREVVG